VIRKWEQVSARTTLAGQQEEEKKVSVGEAPKREAGAGPSREAARLGPSLRGQEIISAAPNTHRSSF
jgi:hypothetical protein